METTTLPSETVPKSQAVLAEWSKDQLHVSGRASRGEFVHEALRSAIRQGAFGRGERIREEEIAKVLGVSRTPVREALQRLMERGLLVASGGRGLFVAELSRQETIELYAMREVLEGSAARFAAQHISDTQISIMHKLLDDFTASGDHSEKLADINRRFHQAIYDAAHNRYLYQMLHDLDDSLALLRDTTFTVRGRPHEADAEHRRILSAIEQRDLNEAENAARIHIRSAQQARLEMFARQGS